MGLRDKPQPWGLRRKWQAGPHDLKFREDAPIYLRTKDRQLRNDFVWNSRWRDADTYEHARKSPGKGGNDKGKRND